MYWVYRGTRITQSSGDYIVPKTFLKTWHVFPRITSCGWEMGFIGWGGQVGADNPEILMGHADGCGYSPTGEEALAEDWELAFCE